MSELDLQAPPAPLFVLSLAQARAQVEAAAKRALAEERLRAMAAALALEDFLERRARVASLSLTLDFEPSNPGEATRLALTVFLYDAQGRLITHESAGEPQSRLMTLGLELELAIASFAASPNELSFDFLWRLFFSKGPVARDAMPDRIAQAIDQTLGAEFGGAWRSERERATLNASALIAPAGRASPRV